MPGVRRLLSTSKDRLTLDWRSSRRPDDKHNDDGVNGKPQDDNDIEKLLLKEQHLSCLEELTLAYYPLSSLILPPPTKSNCFKSLKKLSLSDCNELKELPTSLGNLITIENISICRCKNFRALPSELGKLNNLKRLTLEFCASFESLPPEIGISCQRLEYLGLTSLSKFNNFGTITSSSSLSLPSYLIFKSLKILIVNDCPLIQSLPSQHGFAKNLNSFYVKLLPSLRELPCLIETWGHIKSFHLALCTSLVTLSIGRSGVGGCGNLSNCLETVEITQCDSLHAIQIQPCPQKKSEENSNTLSSSSISTSQAFFPQLKCLILSSCASLSSLPPEIGSSAPCLETFKTFRCPKLVSLPEGFLRSPNNSLKELCLEPFPREAIVRLLCFENNNQNLNYNCLTSLSIAGCHLGNDCTTQILKSLPSTLLKLDLGNNDIDRLDGFFKGGNVEGGGDDVEGCCCILPSRLQYLNLRYNPILDSKTMRQRHFCEELIEQTPQLKFLGMETDTLASQNKLVTRKAGFWLYWNSSGRILLSSQPSEVVEENGEETTKLVTPKKKKKKWPIPTSVWPTVLARIQEIVALSDNFEEYEASIIYLFLHGPALFHR